MGVSTLTTGLVKASFSLTQALDLADGTQKPIGSQDYVVLMYSPSQSVAYGAGASSELPVTSKRSGFSIFQSSGTIQVINASQIFTETRFTQSMAGIYGSQGQTIATNAFIWASHLDAVLLANNLNASGDYYEGEFPFSSLMDEYGNPGLISIADLIRMSGPKKIKSELSMTNSMVNNNLPAQAFQNTKDEVEKGFATELVSYIVIHKAFTPLDADTNVSYSLDIGVRSNFGAFVRTDDQFSRDILSRKMTFDRGNFKDVVKGIDLSDIGNSRSGRPDAYGTTAQAASGAPELSKRIERAAKKNSNWLATSWEWIKDFYSSAKPVVQTALEVASIAGLLAPAPKQQMVDVQMARYQIRTAIGAVKAYKDFSDETLEVYNFLAGVYTRLGQINQNFVPADDLF